MSSGVFDTTGSDAGFVAGVAPGRDGLDGKGIVSMSVLPGQILRILMSDGSFFDVSLPAVTPTFVIEGVVNDLPTAPDGLGPGRLWLTGDPVGGYTLQVTGTRT